MSAAADKSDNKNVPSRTQKSTVILLFTIAADTTWRMFVPIIGGTALGIWADKTYATKPWATIGCIAVGVVIAALLVRNQLKRNIDSDSK